MINQIVDNDNNDINNNHNNHNNNIQDLKYQNVKNDNAENNNLKDKDIKNDDLEDKNYNDNNKIGVSRENEFFNTTESISNNANSSILQYHNNFFKCDSVESISDSEFDISYIHNQNTQENKVDNINDTKVRNRKLSKLKYFINDNSSYSNLNIHRELDNEGNNKTIHHHNNNTRYHDPTITRNRFTTTNFLKPSMIFTGYQISGYKKYQVTVTLKTVNFTKGPANVTSPHMTGFLSINGLTNNHPEISTFFDAYAVTDSEFGFLSSTWDQLNSLTSTDENDLEHWYSFPAFKQFKQFNNVIDNYLNERFIFMRWKEKFLIDDPSLDTIEGASYDGYYYIVHDQYTGNIQGFYYHKDAEKFQQLELMPYAKHPGNSSFEFV